MIGRWGMPKITYSSALTNPLTDIKEKVQIQAERMNGKPNLDTTPKLMTTKRDFT
jgi:hypothetical protein